MYGFHYFFKKSNLCLRTLFPHIKDNDFAFEILIFWLLKVYYWENREYRWKDATVFKKRLSITPASNDQSCKFSPIKQNSQRSQYIFIIHLLDILYDLKILFFLMDASHSWKKTRRHIPHSFLLKKKKKKGTKPKSQIYSGSIFSLASQWVSCWKPLPRFPVDAILAHWANNGTEVACCYSCCKQVNWPPGLPFSLHKKRKQNDNSPGSFRSTKLVQWTTARWVTKI